MSRTTRLGIRAAFAALAIAGAAAAPIAAFADATHPANATFSADPNDVDYYFNGDPGGGGGGGG
jgi:hypothetical protein